MAEPDDESKPDTGTIQLTATAQREVDATSAKVRVTIAGQSYVFGNEAIAKAAEVREFVAGLRAGGIEESSIEVVDVRIDQSSGKLTKASRASYTLEVTCKPPTLLAVVHACVANAKTAELGWTRWHFGDLTAVRDEMTRQCLDDLRARVDRIGQTLGVPVLGLEAYAEQFRSPGDEAVPVPGLGGGSRRSMDMSIDRLASADLGVATTHRARTTFAIDASFRTGLRDA